MAIHFSCPNPECRAEYTTHDDTVGKEIGCSQCGGRLVIPGGSSLDLPPQPTVIYAQPVRDVWDVYRPLRSPRRRQQSSLLPVILAITIPLGLLATVVIGVLVLPGAHRPAALQPRWTNTLELHARLYGKPVDEVTDLLGTPDRIGHMGPSTEYHYDNVLEDGYLRKRPVSG